MDVSAATKFKVTFPIGDFELLRLSAQVSGEAIEASVLSLAQLSALSKDSESDEDKLSVEFNRTARAFLKAAMVAPRLADDDLADGADGGPIGWKTLGSFAIPLFNRLMGSAGDAEVFQPSPLIGEAQS
jgi:hypothetical protein